MAVYVFDTGIVLGYLTKAGYAERVEADFSPSAPGNTVVLSEVVIGEIWSLAFHRNWGERKLQELENLLTIFPTLPISTEGMYKTYAELDAYSNGKLETVDFSSRNMGKNDLWIAATTVLAQGELITTDGDYEHLDPRWFRVHYIRQVGS